MQCNPLLAGSVQGQGFPCKFFPNREKPVFISLDPCNENKFFPVGKNLQGKPSSGPVLTLYGIAVHDFIMYTITHLQSQFINSRDLIFRYTNDHLSRLLLSHILKLKYVIKMMFKISCSILLFYVWHKSRVKWDNSRSSTHPFWISATFRSFYHVKQNNLLTFMQKLLLPL